MGGSESLLDYGSCNNLGNGWERRQVDPLGAPETRHYQARYRDPASFCTPDNFNYTNAITIAWEP